MNPLRSSRPLIAATLLLLGSLLTGNAVQGANEREAAVLASTAGVVAKDDRNFLINLRSGRTMSYGCRPGTDCTSVRLQSYHPAKGLMVFHVTDGDVDDYEVLDAETGAGTFFDANPEFSPNGDVAVEIVYGERIQSFNKRPALSIWRRAGGKFVKEWSVPIQAEGRYSVLGWRSNGEVDIEAVTSVVVNGRAVNDAGRSDWTVIRDRTGWRVVTRKFVPEPK